MAIHLFALKVEIVVSNLEEHAYKVDKRNVITAGEVQSQTRSVWVINLSLTHFDSPSRKPS